MADTHPLIFPGDHPDDRPFIPAALAVLSIVTYDLRSKADGGHKGAIMGRVLAGCCFGYFPAILLKESIPCHSS